MPKLNLEVSAEILEAMRLPAAEVEAELRKELALALYRRGVLPLSKARLLAGMDRWPFDQLLGEHQILRHYTAEDLENDIQYAHGHL